MKHPPDLGALLRERLGEEAWKELERRERMEDPTAGAIASPHWGACETCRNNDKDCGCVLKEDIPLSLYLGDWILCDDYEKKKESDGTT